MALTDLRRPTLSVAPTPPATGGRPPVPARPNAWPRTVLLAVTMMLALAGLHVALTETSWWIVGSLFVLLALITATLVRQLTRPGWLPTVAGALVTLLGLTIGFGADTAVLGIIPTPETVSRFAQLTNDAWGEIAVQSLPATPERSIVFLLAGSCAALALFGDLAIRVAPALTALPILTLLVIPVAVHSDLAEPYWYVLAAVGYLALLRIGRRRSNGVTLLALGAVVVVGSFVVTAIFPSVEQSADQNNTSGVSTGINPLINLGDDLRRGAPVTAVTYTTSNDESVYLRLATLANFDGRAWTPSLATPGAGNRKLSAFPAAVGLTGAVKQSKVTARVEVGGIQGNWLPVPYPTTRVTGTSGDWFWEPQGLSVRTTDTSVKGQKYTASFLAVKPDLAQLRAATVDATAMRPYLELPAGLPGIITNTAAQVAGSAPTEYDQALALEDYFQSGQFTYSTTAPVAQGYDGTGADVVAEFLRKKEGYCVHFASAMAIMARVLGIPARVAVGFQPGTPTSVNGTRGFTVSTHDLHAWPELYFAGIGWLRFEPTPGRGELPDYSVPAAVDELPTDTATDAATAAPTASATPTAQARDNLPTDEASSSTSGSSAGFNAAPVIFLVVLVLLLAGLLAPAVARLAVRWRRETAIARGRDPAANAWAEVRDTARDHGWLAPETETAREFAARLSLVLAEESESIEGFRGRVESSAYGRPDAAPLELHELRAIRRAIAGSVSPRERIRAIFLPASLLARIRFDPDS